MKIFKNKFFIIALSIAIFISILTATLSLMGQTGPIRDAINTVTLPFRYVGLKFNEAIEGFSKYFQSIDALNEENSSLREEIAELESSLADMEATKDENARLREYLDVKKTYPNFSLADALIIGTESENYSTFLTLDRGYGDGVEVGMPVIVKSGLVGSVCEVGYSWCRVRVITEASSGVGAYVERNGELGVVSGDISLKDTGECKLTYLSEDADIEVGDLIYTSGIGSVYPRGLLVGRVTEVGIDEYLRKKTATVDCAVDFESLRYVMIITDFERHVESGEGKG
jgi:rod shape-determining protein MreC